MITIRQADGFGFRSAFKHLVAAAQFQIFDQDDKIAIHEHIAVGVLDDSIGLRRFRLGFARPLMTAGDALPFVREFSYFGHLAHRAGRFAHEETG